MMANDAYIPEFGDDQQQALEDMELYYYEQQVKAQIEHEAYLMALSKGDEHGRF